MASTDLIYIVDLDEFIVPRKDLSPNTTAKLLEIAAAAPRALASEGKQPDALLFRNTFFCSEFNKNVDFDDDFDIFNIFNRQVQRFLYYHFVFLSAIQDRRLFLQRFF